VPVFKRGSKLIFDLQDLIDERETTQSDADDESSRAGDHHIVNPEDMEYENHGEVPFINDNESEDGKFSIPVWSSVLVMCRCLKDPQN
jgi:hypothetical protein